MKPVSSFVAKAGILLLLSILVPPSVTAQIYVDANAIGANNGSSWLDAYVDLQLALGAATSGDEIWVAAGTYYPTAGSDRNATFQLSSGVELYGGFAGGESTLGERNTFANPTILSGDIGLAGPEDNSYHVVSADGTDATAVLDGFTVTGGYAWDHVIGEGGGMYIVTGSPTIRNGTFDANQAVKQGGAVYITTGSPGFTDVTFTNNGAGGTIGIATYTGRGGGVYNASGSPTFDNVSFVTNSVAPIENGADGAGVYSGGNPTFTNLTVSDNTGWWAVFMLNGTMTNATFSGNHNSGLRCGNATAVTSASFIANQGGGMFTTGSPVLNDVLFQDNSANQGAGLNVINGSPQLTNVRFIDNTASGEGGAVFGGGGVLNGVTFIGNTATNRGGAWFVSFGGAPTLANTIFEDNSATRGGAVYASGTSAPMITNCFFNGNMATYGTILFADNSNPVVTNSVLLGSGNKVVNENTAAPTYAHSFIPGSGGSGAGWDASLGVDGGNNVDAVPACVDLAGGDHRPAFGSLAIDAGDNAAPGLPATDFNGDPRINGANVDVGPFEFACPVVSRLYVDAAAIGAADGTSWADAYPTLTEAFAFACPGVTEIWVAEGTYHPSAGPDAAATFKMRNNLAVYGGFTGSESGPGDRDLEATTTTLSGYVGGGARSSHVVTASGTNATAVFDGFTVTGGLAPFDGGGMIVSGGNPTVANVVFDGNEASNRGGGLFLSGATPMLTNLSFVDNEADKGGGLYNASSSPVMTDVSFTSNSAYSNGGAMYNDASIPSLVGATFESNTAPTSGGAIYNTNGSHMTATNAFFHDNTATTGGGMYNFQSNPTIINGVFAANDALSFGGAMYGILANAALTNVSFNGNTAVTAGGAMYNTVSNPTIVNGIFWGDTAPSGPEIANLSGSVPAISYSLIEGSGGSGAGWDPTLGSDGGNNLDSDPLFEDAVNALLRLTTSSPAIDAGNTAAPGLPATDLEGNPRVAGADVDLGAYEWQGTATAIGDRVIPATTAIRSVYPNPFNPSVTIVVDLDRARNVTVDVYNVQGQLVARLWQGTRPPGAHPFVWNGVDHSGQLAATGVYIVKVAFEGWSDHRKVLLLK